jgi:hypothetical protein
MRAHFLIDTELWQDSAIHWTFPAGDYPSAQLTLDYGDGLAAYKTSHFTAARDSLSRMESDARRMNTWMDQRKLEEPQERNRAAVLVDQLRALLSSPNPTAPETISALQTVAAKENALPLEFGPPFIYKPTNEILGEIYLQLNRPADAHQAFEADLARAPGRRLGVRGLTLANQQIPSTNVPPETTKPQTGNNHVHH